MRARRRPPLALGLVLAAAGALAAAPRQHPVTLQWWDGGAEEWKAYECESGVGPCLSYDLLPGAHRVISVYIKRGTKLTIHLNNLGRDDDYHVLMRHNEPPTDTEYDYSMRRKEPGFSQWTCKGVQLFFRVRTTNKSRAARFGVTLTEDACVDKDYSKRCPAGWTEKGHDGWCSPPSWYKGACKKQNFFGDVDLGHEYSNPASKVYKLLWAERCGADWPCKDIVGRQCTPNLSFVEGGDWRHAECRDGQTCHSFSLAPQGARGDWRMLMVDVPAGASIGFEVTSIFTVKSVARFRDQVIAAQHDLRGADDAAHAPRGDEYTLSVRKGDVADGEAWEWAESFRGHAPYVELHNPDCSSPVKFFLGLYNQNEAGTSKVAVTLSRLLNAPQTKHTASACAMSHVAGSPEYLGLTLAPPPAGGSLRWDGGVEAGAQEEEEDGEQMR